MSYRVIIGGRKSGDMIHVPDWRVLGDIHKVAYPTLQTNATPSVHLSPRDNIDEFVLTDWIELHDRFKFTFHCLICSKYSTHPYEVLGNLSDKLRDGIHLDLNSLIYTVEKI